MKLKVVLFPLVITTITGCYMPQRFTTPTLAPVNTPAVALEPEIVFHNGAILTMEGDTANDGLPQAQAILIRGDTIAAVGDDAEVLAQAGPSAAIIDLQGRTVTSGFIDSHNHRIAWSLVGGDYKTPQAAINTSIGIPARVSGYPGTVKKFSF